MPFRFCNRNKKKELKKRAKLRGKEAARREAEGEEALAAGNEDEDEMFQLPPEMMETIDFPEWEPVRVGGELLVGCSL